jgi:hypothetical protein
MMFINPKPCRAMLCIVFVIEGRAASGDGFTACRIDTPKLGICFSDSESGRMLRIATPFCPAGRARLNRKLFGTVRRRKKRSGFVFRSCRGLCDSLTPLSNNLPNLRKSSAWTARKPPEPPEIGQLHCRRSRCTMQLQITQCNI